MPKKKRNYKKEYARDHAPKKDRVARSNRNKARRKLGLKVGDKREVDHKRPISKGGSNKRSNLRATSRRANRRKGAK